MCQTDVNGDVDALVVCRALGWRGSAALSDAPGCADDGAYSCQPETLPGNLTVAWTRLECAGGEASPAECAHQDANWQVRQARTRPALGRAAVSQAGRQR